MLLCPTCGAAWPEPARACPTDGAALQPAADLDWRIGSQIGNYRLLDLLGKGGMGAVYRAEHVFIGKPLAVKILHDATPVAVERLLREARAAAIIGHPNIVDVTDFGETDDGQTYFVMELVEGRSLDHVIEAEAPLALLRAINIVNQIGRGLAAAHEKGIVHRDLKPANVMLQRRAGRREIVRRTDGDDAGERFAVEREESYDFVKILDFGVAKVLDEGAAAASGGREIPGTPEYMAPEAIGDGPVDHRLDVYSLGVMFYEMLTGRVPFEGESSLDVLLAHRDRLVPPPRFVCPTAEITDAAERLILRALAKDPAERPATMEQFLVELQGCYGSETFRRDVERQMPEAVAAGIQPKKKRLTEDLAELFATGDGSEILERALEEPESED